MNYLFTFFFSIDSSEAALKKIMPDVKSAHIKLRAE